MHCASCLRCLFRRHDANVALPRRVRQAAKVNLIYQSPDNLVPLPVARAAAWLPVAIAPVHAATVDLRAGVGVAVVACYLVGCYHLRSCLRCFFRRRDCLKCY